MKHLKEEKQKKSLSRGAKIGICTAIGIFVAVAVCMGLWLTNRVTGYREAKGYTEEILGYKSAIESFIDAEAGENGIGDNEKKLFNDFSDAVKKTSDYMESIGATGVLKNETVNEQYETAKNDLQKLLQAKDICGKLMDVLSDNELSEEDLVVLKDLDNDYLKTMASDISDYREKVVAFNTKYAEIKGANKTQLDNDYAELVAAGDDITKKYSEIKFDDVLGMSRDDILHFYGTIEELDKYLADKK